MQYKCMKEEEQEGRLGEVRRVVVGMKMIQ